MKALHYVTFTFLTIGGLNWGLVGFFDWNLVTAIFSGGSGIANIIYAIVGLSALYEIFTHGKTCKTCSSKKSRGNGEDEMDMEMDMDM